MHIIGSPDLDNLENRAQAWYQYSSHKAYADSKLLILASMYALNRKLRKAHSCVSVCVLHPGVVRTDLWKHLTFIHKYPLGLIGKFLYLTPEQGADTTLYAALSPEVESVSGCYYDNSQPCRSARLTYDEDFQDFVWDKTSALVKNLAETNIE
ncbi:DHRSX-like protein [Mya arenaria]|uniref:DHRSX-like protein n=2 Tax=Mya arenaria TaxID=6604 RepID=A0ABY7DKD4_MYAAR|nr:DHRSX-like protein [Mya arenaria]